MKGIHLINLIKANHLEDAEIILGCQGYDSMDKDTNIHACKIGDKVLLSDNCNYDETIKKMLNTPKDFMLGDGFKIKASEEINITQMELDELENEAWNLFTMYMDVLGIEYDEGECCDWFIVKQIQETILKQFEDAGISFRNDNER